MCVCGFKRVNIMDIVCIGGVGVRVPVHVGEQDQAQRRRGGRG